jgi:Methyltransferase domain
MSATHDAERTPRVGLERRMRNAGKRGLRAMFEAGQRVGLDILPRHFYSSVPDIRELKRDERWKLPHSLVGVRGADLDGQLEQLGSWCSAQARDRLVRESVWSRACEQHGEPGYGPVDADVLWAFVASARPRRIVQIGAGVSTAVILDAAAAANHHVDVLCVDPFPTTYLTRLAREGRIRLVGERAQDVDLDVLTDLGDRGMLFVDSTHAVRPDSEVNRIVLEVLPRLAKGAWVHFHDITLPFNYQRGLMSTELFFSSESAFLHAFLVQNEHWRLGVSLSMLHHARSDELRQILPTYRPEPSEYGLRRAFEAGTVFPSSAYLLAD